MNMQSPVEAIAELSSPDEPAPPASGRAGGYVMLLTAAVVWGVSWPISKQLLQYLPPLSMRGISGFVGGVFLFLPALISGQSLRVPRDQWLRLALYSMLSVAIWMAFIGVALVKLPASETAVLSASIPVWAAGLAWPVLGERMTFRRAFAMVLAITGIVVLMGGHGISGMPGKITGIALVLVASFSFGLSAVLAKLKPLALPPLTSSAWQIIIGTFAVMMAGFVWETPHLAQLPPTGWLMFTFVALIQVGLGFACWYGALSRLSASSAGVGTMLVPVIGVVASAVALGEPLGVTQIGALALTIAGVAIATR